MQKILLDTNVWRYLIDSGQEGKLFQIAKRSDVKVAVAPSIVLETLRLGDHVLRKKIVEVLSRECWLRLMPDAYKESEELKNEILRCRPEWALKKSNSDRFKNLRYDWIRSKGGFWSKVRSETDAIAEQYSVRDTGVLNMARGQAIDTREAVLRRGEKIVVGKSLSKTPGSWTRANGERVETDFWRVYAHTTWETALSTATPFRQWLSCDIDVLPLITYHAEEFMRFWASDVLAIGVPRAWIRAAMFALQSEHKVTAGTPADAQIAINLLDVDQIVSADKNFVSIVNRIRGEAPCNMGKASLIPGGDAGIEYLFNLISSQ